MRVNYCYAVCMIINLKQYTLILRYVPAKG